MQGLFHPAIRVWTFLVKPKQEKEVGKCWCPGLSRTPLWGWWGIGVRGDHDIKGYGQVMGEEGSDALCPIDHSFSPGPAPQAQQPPTLLSFPHSLNSHSWRKRYYSSHCRTGADTGCSENACSLLGPVRMRTCTWGSL